MKILIVVLAEILLALLFLLFASNYGEGSVFCNILNKEVSYQVFAAVVYLIGGLTTVLIYTVIDISQTKKLAAYKKDREKSSVESAEKDSTINALENKIKTLEAALESVMKKEDNK